MISTMKEKLSRAYEAVQNLQLQPTKHNVAILAGVLEGLEHVYKELDGMDVPEAPADEEEG